MAHPTEAAHAEASLAVPVEGTAARARLRQMVVDHFQFIWRTLRRLVPPEAVDDAVQRVFMVAMRKIQDIVPGSERPFLFKTALWVAQLIRRTQARQRAVLEAQSLQVAEDPAPLPDEAADWKVRRRLLNVVLDGMRPELRQAFVLFELEGMPIAEMAELLGVPRGTVCSRLRRAREQFHERARRVRARLEAGGLR